MSSTFTKGDAMPKDGATASRTPEPGPKRRLRDIGLSLGLFALVLLGLFSLALATGWEETVEQLSHLGLLQVGALLGLSLVNYLFRASRWHLCSQALGLGLGFTNSLRHFLAGFAMSVTPARVGELVRLRWIARETGWRPERAAPLVLIDRASDLAAMALILALSLVFAVSGTLTAAFVAALALLAAWVATRPHLLAGLIGLLWRITGRWPRLFARARGVARSLEAFSRPALLIPALTLGFIGWLAEGYAFWLLLDWFGAGLSFWTAVGIFTFATLAGGLTGAPGGVGGAEAAMIALLALEGVAPEISVPATVIIRVTTLWFAIGIGMLAFPLAERHSKKVRNALEN